MPATKTNNKPLRAAPIPRALREQVNVILEGKLDYMDSPTFRRKHVEQELFSGYVADLPMVAWYQPTRDEEIEPSASTPTLMSADEERTMFLRFNYAKRRVHLAAARANKTGLTRALADEIVQWNAKVEQLREYLVRTNLALVLAMAKRTRLGDVDFAEVVSEGNMALLRAIEKFNVERGFKFSTYACRAILKAFSRTAQKHTRHRTRFPVEFEPDLEKSDWIDTKRNAVQDDLTDELRQIVDRNLADLSDTEQTVIRQRFNWQQTEDAPLTLEEVGRIIGVTKERVRQIQNKALAKIKRRMEEGYLRETADTESADLLKI
ncbi:MAG TPA: sigma-70 family RNA polymerase sigma factor [Tepidisphaeraceae bacterium]|nr:sigma-70 family RNA polymerase sigma factor [Tepidisphaeraceae bacterium]